MKSSMIGKILKSALCVLLMSCLLFTLVPASAWEAPPKVGNKRWDYDSANANVWEEIEKNTEAVLRNPRLMRNIEDSDLPGAEVYHDRYSRTYLLADGSYITRIFEEPITYTDEEGQEQDIDNSLVPEDGEYTNEANSYDLRLPKNGQGLTMEKDGYTLELLPLFGELKNGVVSDNAIRYNGVAAGVDLQYTATGDGVKEDIIVNNPDAGNVFKYKLVGEGIRFEIKDGVVYGYATGVQEPVFEIKAPIMTDASGDMSIAVTLTLGSENGVPVLTVTADAEWLAAPERAFPVFIDPIYKLEKDNLLYGVVQAYSFGSIAGPNVEHKNNPYLYVGFENGGSTGTVVSGLMYGECWSYIKILDITPYITDLPEDVILSASLNAYKYVGMANPMRNVDAKMIVDDWGGNGRYTWANRPLGGGLTDLANGQDVSGSVDRWISFDITEAFKAWVDDETTNRGIMLTPRDESQRYVCFSGDERANQYGKQAVYFELAWTVPNAIDEDLPLDAPAINLRPLTYKHTYGIQNVVGVFADGVVRPALQVDYQLNDVEYGSYDSAEYGPIFPNSDLFAGEVPFTLGYTKLYESNWQSGLFKTFDFNTIYNVYATATDGTAEGTTPEGVSDSFIIYQMQAQDTIPYVAAYYGVTRDQIVRDNRVGDDLMMPGNTLFIRNPQQNATIPYTRPDNLTIEQKRSIIYANMGRNQLSEFDIEPVNMNTGNYWFESVDAENTEYVGNFLLRRTYNSLSTQTAGGFGRGWSFEYIQALTGREDGGVTWHTGDGKELIFASNGSGGWISPVGYNYTLTKIPGTDTTPTRYEISTAGGKVYSFDDYGILQTITEANGLKTVIHYDSNYKLTGVTTGSGRYYGITTNASGQITAIILPNGGVLGYTYDAQGFLTEFITADNDHIRYTYDANGQMNAWYDGNGNRVIFNEFDSEGRVIKQTDAGGQVSTLSYDDAEGNTTLVNAGGETKVYEYDDQLRTTGIETAAGETDKTWNANNQLTSTTDALGQTITYEYDANGNITKETRSDGTWRQVIYDTQNRPTYIRDFDGAVTRQDFDAAGNLVERTLPDGSTTQYTYDQYRRTTSITDGMGNKTTFTYDGLTSMVANDPLGNKTTCYYDAMGRLINEVDPLGNQSRTSYSPGGRKLETWLADSGDTNIYSRVQYQYDGAGNCVAIIDANGNKSTYGYDAQNRMIKATDPRGYSKTYTYDNMGRKLSETDPIGNMTSYEYDAAGNLIKVTDALGGVESYTYDAMGRQLTHADKHGFVSSFEYDPVSGQSLRETTPVGTTECAYDAAGRLIQVNYADGTFDRFEYDIMGRTSKQISSAGIETVYKYDLNGLLVEVSDSLGRVTTSVYDATGRLTAETDELGRETVYTYDAAGRMISETAPGGLKTEYCYDAASRRIEVIRPDGTSLKYEYDNAGNVTAEIDALGNRTEYRYDKLGNLAAKRDALGGVISYEYNANGLMIKQTGALGETTTYEYDDLNRQTVITDALGNKTLMEYDAAGSVTATVMADGTRSETEYDQAGRTVKIIDASGVIIEYEYDTFGRKIREHDNAGNDTSYEYNTLGQVIKLTDQLGRTCLFEYDVAGNQTKKLDFNGDVETVTFDLLGRLISRAGNDGRITIFVYDEAGNKISETDADGQTISYEYDLLGRLVKTVDPLGRITEQSYDDNGNLIKAVAPGGSAAEYTYDELNRKVSEVSPLGGVTTYSYDSSGREIKRVDAMGAVYETAYDAMGHAVAVKDPYGYVTESTYDEMGRRLTVTSPLGAVTRYEYDVAGNQISIIDPLGNVTRSEYGLAGRLLSTTTPNGLKTKYTYDALGRTIRVEDSAGNWTETEYDSRSNIVRTSSCGGGETIYEYDNMHRVTREADALGAVTVNQYNSRGNLTKIILPTGGEVSYAYDELDRVIRAERSLTEAIEYVYDEAGRQVKTIQAGIETSKIYDTAGNVLTETDGNGNTTSYTYDLLGRQLTATDPNNNITTTEYDLMGRTIKTIDALGGEISFAFDADGRMIEQTDVLGHKTTYEYNAAGWLIKLTDSLNREATYTYDVSGNMVYSGHSDGTTGGKGTRYEYDLHGNRTKVVSPSGATEIYEYDAAGRLISETRPNGSVVNYSYDALGNVLAKDYIGTDSDVSYTYNAVGNRLTMTDISGTTRYEYDILGTLTAASNAAGKLRYAYNTLGQIESVTYPDGRVANYTYDAVGQMLEVVNVKGRKTETTTYVYDAVGNVLTKESGGMTTAYTYDTLNRVTSVENTKGGKIVSSYRYQYDAADRVTTETAIVNGKTTEKSYTYDAAGQLLKVIETTGGKTTTTSYSYGLFGDRIETVRGASGGRTVSSYDVDGKLIAQTVSGVTTNLTYDANGNLTQSKTGGVTTTYAYDAAGRLTAVRRGGALIMSAGYDGDGERLYDLTRQMVGYEVEPEIVDPTSVDPVDPVDPTPIDPVDPSPPSKGDENLFWFGFGQSALTSISIFSLPSAPTLQVKFYEWWDAQYTIIPETPTADDLIKLDGQPGGMETGAVDNDNDPETPPVEIEYRLVYSFRYYLNDILMSNTQVAAETTKTGATRTDYVYGLERISSSTQSYLYDGRGSVVQVGSKMLTYDAYGSPTSGSNKYQPEFAYNAESYNPETGLIYLRARYYAPKLGMFITQDSFTGVSTRINSWNRYSYAENDPVNNQDPSGHAIGNTSYERLMEANGGINEIYNAYVGKTLQNKQRAANGAFYGYLSAVQGIDAEIYGAQEVINAISQIPQSVANNYINAGAACAKAAGRTWGCVPGDLTNQAIKKFAANVNASRRSVNSQISAVKEQKQTEYNQYLAELALEAVQRGLDIINNIRQIFLDMMDIGRSTRQFEEQVAELMKTSNEPPVAVTGIAIGLAAADGPLPIGDILAGLLLAIYGIYAYTQHEQKMAEIDLEIWSLQNAVERQFAATQESINNSWAAIMAALAAQATAQAAKEAGTATSTVERDYLIQLAAALATQAAANQAAANKAAEDATIVGSTLVQISINVGDKVIDTDNLPEGWTKTEHNGFIHIKDENGNIRVRIDPPDGVTNYRHYHIYDQFGNSLDVDGNIVDPRNPDAHIPYNE